MTTYEERRDYALRKLPALARNPLLLPEATCFTCATPTSGYFRCYKCDQQSYNPGMADVVVPLTYAGPRNRQMQRDLFNYKGSNPAVARQARENLVWLVWWAATHHMRCIEFLNGPVDAITTVPSRSVNKRPNGHPLEQFAFHPSGDVPTFRLERIADQPDRAVHPETLNVPIDVTGMHVLLYDDTWTTGANAQGAAAALKLAGARAVSVIVIGRWLGDNYGPTDAFLKTHGDDLWTQDICPVTRGACPV